MKDVEITTFRDVRPFTDKVVAYKCKALASYLSGGSQKFSLLGKEEWTYGLISKTADRASGFVAGTGYRIHVLYKYGLLAGGPIFLTTPEISFAAGGSIIMRTLSKDELSDIAEALRDKEAIFDFGFAEMGKIAVLEQLSAFTSINSDADTLTLTGRSSASDILAESL